MKKIISVSLLLFCFVLVSAQNKDQVKKQVSTQTKTQVKKPVTQQNKSQVKKPVTPPIENKIKSPVIPCKWQKNEVDPFTGVSARTTSWEVVGYNNSMNSDINNGLTGTYNFAISQNIQNKDTTYALWIRTSTSQRLCFNNDSKILIKSGDKILTINLIGGVVCGDKITSNGNVDSVTRKFLKKHTIDLLRIQFSGDGNTVVNVDLKNGDKSAKLDPNYFITTFRCF